MAQLAPTTLQYGQLMTLVQDFLDEYSKGEMTDIELVSEQINDIVTQYNAIDGRPMLDFEDYVKGEPAESDKMNRMWKRLQDDINIVQDQLEVLRAAVVFVHNFIVTEVELAKNQNAQAANKLKTLQLYTTANDSSVIQFGDYFNNLDFVDLALVPSDQKPHLLAAGQVSLAREPKTTNLTDDIDVRVLDTSNGFSGNNQEIADPSNAIVDPVDNKPTYIFKSEIDGRHAELDDAIDGQPNTWFEYENYWVSPGDRQKAKDLNFVYRAVGSAANTAVSNDVNPAGAATNTTTGLIDWAKGPANGILVLNLEFDLKEPRVLNAISITPFGLEINKNAPINIKLVQTSENGTDWTPISPQNVYVATDANLQSARSAENVSIGSALFAFDERSVRYVRMTMEQKEAIACNIGHLYYETKKTVTYEKKVVPHPSIPNATTTLNIPITHGGDRAEGPIPPVNEPDRYYSDNGLLSGNLVQGVEYFVGKRWAIGIRDILIEESKYKETTIVVSKPFRVAGVIDRVSIEADTFIPSNFPEDPDSLWIKFFVSPDDGLNWYPISRIQDDYLGIPEVIAFNDPIPAEFREIGVDYIATNSVVNSLRVKVEMSRPEELDSSSPILRSYKLKVIKR